MHMTTFKIRTSLLTMTNGHFKNSFVTRKNLTNPQLHQELSVYYYNDIHNNCHILDKDNETRDEKKGVSNNRT